MSGKKTLVLGATNDPGRYAFKAAINLMKSGHDVVLVGKKKGEVEGQPILNDYPEVEGVDTVTLYVGTTNLPPLFDYILSLKPKRIIFNPGTYHPELEQRANKQGVETVNGCTLVMLAINNY